jgi:hypothetical protein
MMFIAIKVIGYTSLAVVQTRVEGGASIQRNKPMIMTRIVPTDQSGFDAHFSINQKCFHQKNLI